MDTRRTHPLAVHAHDSHGHDACHDSHGHDSHGHGDEEALPDNGIVDLRLREICALVPLVVFMVWIGLQPEYFLKRMSPTLTQLTQSANQAAQQTAQTQEPATARLTQTAAETGELDRVR